MLVNDGYRMLIPSNMAIYPLVNVYMLLWKNPPFLMGKLTISMVIFNSYVCLPEGR
jgi:hypothetical protein